jgi:sugar lactone lactonase YvrE
VSTPTGLPPIFANAPVELVLARQIADFPVNTFLESIAVDTHGTIFFTSHLDGQVFRIGTDGILTVHATITGKAAGLVFTPDGNLLLSAWNEQNIPTVFIVSPQGKATVLVTIKDGIFLNGLTPLKGNRYLIADSYLGAIWELDTTEKTTKIWLQHPLLARSSPDQEFPAVNGLKIYKDALYASNTEKMQIIRIPLQPDGQAGEPEIFVQNVNVDDFAFDGDGNLYGTTHIYNSVVKITPNGSITIIAQAEQGITGSTALAFGQTEKDCTGIYVVTNGGMSYPPPTGIESARVVFLDVGIQGLPIS